MTLEEKLKEAIAQTIVPDPIYNDDGELQFVHFKGEKLLANDIAEIVREEMNAFDEWKDKNRVVYMKDGYKNYLYRLTAYTFHECYELFLEEQSNQNKE